MERICIKNKGAYHSLEKMKPQLFFLKKPSLVISTTQTDLGLRSRTFSLKIN